MQLIATKLQCISIHAPRTGSDRRRGHGLPHGVISIHAPRTGSDGRGASAAVGQARFQSTLPARGATHAQKAVVLTLPISIHAPRTGSDTVLAPSRTQSNDFNPRSPHGERLRLHQRRRFQLLFQSTLPARGATGHWVLTASTKQFQSTLPARGATAGGCNNPRLAHDFNPRSPHGERRFQIKQRASPRNFNPRSPHGERQVSNQARHLTGHFNPRSPHGERRNRDGFRPCA